MRLALLSDVHGNSIALDAVIRDIENSGGVDAHYVLGDLSAIGFDPVGALERLVELPNVRFIRGNTDRYIVTGERPAPTVEDGALAHSGWLDWTAALELDDRVELPDGATLHLVHASPGTDDGRGCRPDASDEELASIVADLAEDVLCVGHTHMPFDRRVGGKRVVNIGNLSNPHRGDLRATYVIVDSDASGHTIEHRRVEYDYDAVLKAIDASGHPNPDFLAHFFNR
jgi:putative phosphoesterase